MRNQAYQQKGPIEEAPKKRRWSWLAPGRTPDPDVIDLSAYRRRRDAERPATSRAGQPKGGAA